VIDHLSINVSDMAASKRFYEAALKPLGYSMIMDFGDHAAGLGEGGKPDFWLGKGAPHPSHVAFRSPDRATVDAFYAAAIAAGGRDNGPPGLRAQYHPGYYGAFVLDPDGYNVEAVCHQAP
jgi:catechol 2,3-dioxygenase-like lactoylglutathione lyase family enzyme